VQSNQSVVQTSHAPTQQTDANSAVGQKSLQQVGQPSAKQTESTSEEDNLLRAIFIVLGIVAVAIAAYYYFVLNQGPKTPEETARYFVEALNDRNEDKLASYVLPSSIDELLYDIDFTEVPRGLGIEFIRVSDVDYYDNNNMVDIEAEVHLISNNCHETEEVLMDFEMVRVKKRWFIVDIY